MRNCGYMHKALRLYPLYLLCVCVMYSQYCIARYCRSKSSQVYSASPFLSSFDPLCSKFRVPLRAPMTCG